MRPPTDAASSQLFEIGVFVHGQHQIDHVAELGGLDRLAVDVHVLHREQYRPRHHLELGPGLHGAALDLDLDHSPLEHSLRIAVDVFYGQSNGLFEAVLVGCVPNAELLDLLEQAVPRVVVEVHVEGQVVSLERRHRDVLDALGVGKPGVFEVAVHVHLDVLEGLPVPVGRVHFVDAHDQVLDVHSADDVDVLLGLALVHARFEAPPRRVWH